MRKSVVLAFALSACGSSIEVHDASITIDASAFDSALLPDLASAADGAIEPASCMPLVDGCVADTAFVLPAGSSIAGGGVSLAMQADGNLVVYRQSDDKALFSTSAMQRFDANGFSGPTTGLDCGGCTATFGADGNLVLTRADGSEYWASNTAGHPSAKLGIRTTSPFFAIEDAGVTLHSSLMQSAHITDLNTQLTMASLPLDYQVQDVCVDVYDHPIAGDAATCATRRNLRIGEASPFLRTDVDTANNDTTYQALVSFPVPDVNGDLLVMTMKTNAGPFDPTYTFTFEQARDGFDLVDFAGDYVSFIRTSDGGCLDQEIEGPSSRLDGWILHPTTYPFPNGPTNDPFLVHAITMTRLEPQSALPASCVSGNSKNGVYQAQSHSAMAEDVWNAPAPVTFESGKTLDTVVTYHYATQNLSATGNALERYFFTSEYGFTRWEAWVPTARCPSLYGDNSPWCDPTSTSSPLYGRCSPNNLPATATWGNQPWIRVDCRDSTNYIALDTPTLPLDPSMGTSNGLVDVDDASVFAIATP